MFAGETSDTLVKGFDEMLFGILYKILCFIFRKNFDLGKGMPILKRKLDLSNFLNLAKELLFGLHVTHQSQL